MKSLVQEERLTALIKSSLNLMCKTSLHYDSEVEIKGLLGITLDKKNVFLVDVKEIITLGDSNDQSDLEAEQDVGDDEQDDSSNVLPSTAKRNYTSAKNSRTLKRNRRIVKDQEVGGVEGEPKQKKRHGKGYSANGDNSGGQQENNVDLDYCVVKVEKQENDDTDLNTSDILPVSNEVVEASQMAGDCADDYDNGGNEDSDNEVGESTIEKTPFDSKKGVMDYSTMENSVHNVPSDGPGGSTTNIITVTPIQDSEKVEINSNKANRQSSVIISYRCDVTQCSFTTTNKTSLKNHEIRLHQRGDKKFKCQQCNFAFIYNSELTKHMKLHSLLSVEICETCGKRFNSKSGLQYHMIRKHNEQGKYKCDYAGCNKSFERKDVLTDHVNKHLGVMAHKCTVCFKTFSSKPNLYHHMERSQGHSEREQQCTICCKLFRTKGDLKQHQQAHSDDIKSCSKCGKSFKYKSNLYRHVKSCS